MKRPMLASAIAVALLAGCAGAPNQPTATNMVDPANFADRVANDDMTEMAMARLALDRASSADVRGFAQHMMADHMADQHRLDTVAAQSGALLPQELSLADQIEIDKLANLTGRDFDQAYMDRMVTDHREDFRAFESAANGGTSPVAQFARDSLPRVRSRLEQAETVDVLVDGGMAKQAESFD